VSRVRGSAAEERGIAPLAVAAFAVAASAALGATTSTLARAQLPGRPALSAGSAASAVAWPDADGVRAPRRASAFWRAARRPGAAAARPLLESAAALLRAAARMPRWSTTCRQVGADAGAAREVAVRRMVLLENALARADLAARRDPEEPAALLLAAEAVELWERPELGCAVSRRDAETLVRYRELRERFPEVAPELVLSSLAIAASRTGDEATAIAAYREVIALAAHRPRQLALAHGNLAETLMMRGDLREALEHYRAAEEAATAADEPTSLALARYGLAAVLARLGERGAAVEAARRAVEADGDDLDTLRADGVFFEPAYEVHFYEALGHQARADGTRAPLPHAPARPSANEEILARLENALTRPLPAAALDGLARAVAVWLHAHASEAGPAAVAAARRALETAITDAASASEAAPTAPGRGGSTRDATSPPQDGVSSGVVAPAARRRLRMGNLVAAARAWLRYLGEGGADSRWAPGVREHLAALADEITGVDASVPHAIGRVDTRASPRDGSRRPHR
jgi:tetratricopeptide (TPR) repeat protein